MTNIFTENVKVKNLVFIVRDDIIIIQHYAPNKFQEGFEQRDNELTGFGVDIAINASENSEGDNSKSC